MEGKSLLDLFGGPSAAPRVKASQKRLADLAAQEGLPMGEREMTYNSRLAQELGVWAAEKGKGEAFHNAVFRAYFVEAKNIASTELLVEIAGEVGLDKKEARRVVDQRLYLKAVDDDWAQSRAAGVTGVPTFMAGDGRVVGAHPYEELEKLVVEAGAKKRSRG